LASEWAQRYMITARNLGILDGSRLPAEPSAVVFRDGAPRWYIAQLLGNFMVVYSDAANIDEVVATWTLANPCTCDADASCTICDTPVFPDIPATHPQHDVIVALATMGVLQGFPVAGGGYEFRPLGVLQRDHAAAGLTRMMAALGHTTTGFPAVDGTDRPTVEIINGVYTITTPYAERGFAEWGLPFISPYIPRISSATAPSIAFMYYHGIMGNMSGAANIYRHGYRYEFRPFEGFTTQMLITGMVRMMAHDDWTLGA